MDYEQYSKSLQGNTNYTRTDNGAIQHKNTLDSCVDFFYATLETPDCYYQKFLTSLKQDRLITLKILFFHRDIRGQGQGRRANFRYVLTKLDEWSLNTPELSCNSIFEYGRYDDMLCLLDTKAGKDVLLWTKTQLKAENALVAKWLPREASSKPGHKFLAKRIAKFLGLTSKQYRKRVSALTKVVETQMTSNDWHNIDYNTVPSQAILRYRNAFNRHSPQNYQAWLNTLTSGSSTSKINVSTTLPHQIIQNYGTYPVSQEQLLEEAWKALPKIELNSLVVADTSGSMHGMPMVVSLALAIYLSERNPYGGFITFSERPSWHIIDKENTLFQKLKTIESINALNTNLEEVFSLLIDSYLETDMIPEQLVIISDMEFDSAIGARQRYDYNPIDKVSFFHKMKKRFTEMGAKFPQIIFWNVRGGSSGVPVTADENGVILISGFNPQFLNQLQNGEEFSPRTFMLQSISNINPQI